VPWAEGRTDDAMYSDRDSTTRGNNRSLMSGSDGQDQSILLVEDNMLNEMVALGMLRLLDRSADVAVNGQAALDAVHRQRYEIVLMDIQMPVMDGLTATRRIRAELAPEQQPYIIALTANAMAGDEQRCLDAGMDAYLSKPLSKEQLRSALAEADGRSVSRRS
jgi:CheY-like chemotaxis protein